MCTQKKTYVHKKQKQKTYICFILFFLCTQKIRVNNFPLCKKACLWHVLDSWFRTLASYFSYCMKIESCKNLFCALSFSPKKFISSKTRDFSRTRFVASQQTAITRKSFYSCKPIWGGNLIVPPHLTPQIQCLPDIWWRSRCALIADSFR